MKAKHRHDSTAQRLLRTQAKVHVSNGARTGKDHFNGLDFLLVHGQAMDTIVTRRFHLVVDDTTIGLGQMDIARVGVITTIQVTLAALGCSTGAFTVA